MLSQEKIDDRTTFHEYEKVGSIYVTSIDSSEIFHTNIYFAAVREETIKSPKPVINRQNGNNDDVYLVRLEIWHSCSYKTLFCFMKPADYTYYIYFLMF